jgi:hypothetical protein
MNSSKQQQQKGKKAQPQKQNKAANNGEKKVRPPRNNKGKGRPTAVAAAYSTGQSSVPADIKATRDSCRVVHRELVASISGGSTTAFAVASTLALNPGISSTFPWLSSLAVNWEMYRFNRLGVRYYTRCGSGTAGSVIMSPDYDAADPAPSTELVASSNMGAVEDAPWKDQFLNLRPAELHALGPKKYVRSVALAANLDLKTYDAGNVFICTVDSAAAAGWGKIWVEYDVTFYSPQVNPQAINSLFLHVSGVTPTSTSLMGTQTTESASLVNPAVVSGEVVTFLVAGTYLIVYNATATTSLTVTANPVAGAGGALSTGFGTSSTGLELAGSGTTLLMQAALMTAIVGSTLTFDNTIVAGLLSDIYITQVPSTAV